MLNGRFLIGIIVALQSKPLLFLIIVVSEWIMERQMANGRLSNS
jgi:hypothetical protein